MTFFRPCFSDFPYLFQIFPVFTLCDPFLHEKNHISENKFPDDTSFFLLCSYFSAHPTTLLLKILGGRMHGPSPTSNFVGTVPPVSVGIRPCAHIHCTYIHYTHTVQYIH